MGVSRECSPRLNSAWIIIPRLISQRVTLISADAETSTLFDLSDSFDRLTRRLFNTFTWVSYVLTNPYFLTRVQKSRSNDINYKSETAYSKHFERPISIVVSFRRHSSLLTFLCSRERQCSSSIWIESHIRADAETPINQHHPLQLRPSTRRLFWSFLWASWCFENPYFLTREQINSDVDKQTSDSGQSSSIARKDRNFWQWRHPLNLTSSEPSERQLHQFYLNYDYCMSKDWQRSIARPTSETV